MSMRCCPVMGCNRQTKYYEIGHYAFKHTFDIKLHHVRLFPFLNQPFFRAFTMKSWKNVLLASPCLSVRLFVCNSSRTAEQIFMKFDMGKCY
jgi:hypothetical protein